MTPEQQAAHDIDRAETIRVIVWTIGLVVASIGVMCAIVYFAPGGKP